MPLTLALCYGQLVSVAEVPRVANDKHTHATISICARDGAAGWLSIGPYLMPVAHTNSLPVFSSETQEVGLQKK